MTTHSRKRAGHAEAVRRFHGLALPLLQPCSRASPHTHLHSVGLSTFCLDEAAHQGSSHVRTLKLPCRPSNATLANHQCRLATPLSLQLCFRSRAPVPPLLLAHLRNPQHLPQPLRPPPPPATHPWTLRKGTSSFTAAAPRRGAQPTLSGALSTWTATFST